MRPDESLVCELDRTPLYKMLFVAETLEDMQTLYDSYAAGHWFGVRWFTGQDVGFVVAR